jgi:hypothetical protein
MRSDREIDVLPSKVVGRRREGRICRALGEAGARYVLIGGFAVILHGGERTTKDIDLLVDPAADNVERLRRAVLEADAARFRPGSRRACPATWRRSPTPPRHSSRQAF